MTGAALHTEPFLPTSTQHIALNTRNDIEVCQSIIRSLEPDFISEKGFPQKFVPPNVQLFAEMKNPLTGMMEFTFFHDVRQEMEKEATELLE